LMAVARFLPDGTLDPTFSPGSFAGGGKLRESFGLGYSSYRLALGRSGTILVADAFVGLHRLAADGSPDFTFGSAGCVSLDFSAIDPLLEADGKLIVVG